MDALKTEVLFRVSKGDRQEVVAILSDAGAVTFDARGEATCYAHAGQHGTCHVAWYLDPKRTRVARPPEYAALKKELESIGYDLIVRFKRRVR